MNDKFLKPYSAKDIEDKIYSVWEESGYFNPDKCVEDGVCAADAEPFSIVLPPPNVTGTLHTGHSMMLAIEDTMVRFARMQGKKTLWLPGTDHAAIATESVVVKQLAKQKINKRDLGREAFLEKVNDFAKESHITITKQLKKMGASLDWSREAFTLDDDRRHAVYTAFTKMYKDGLIYRGDRIVNWDPKGQTTVSDDEVNHEPRKGKMYYFKYSADFPITIATTRPETKIGDTAVAVNPKDERYKEYVGKTFEVDFVGVPLKIKVIADEDVDSELGTGALGVTPSHSQIDWALAEKHNLEKIQVINEYAKISIDHPEYLGKKVLEAREIIVNKLRDSGLLEKEEEIDQNISVSERTGAIIEPLPKLQWWIDVNNPIADREGKTLKELMMEAVTKHGVKILPERFEKIYKHWIANLRDWNISRQIWYGHQVPVWYKGEEIYVGTEAPEGSDWIQDEDTLDTWFSSGLWTFSTLGWPNDTEDLKTFHPTSVLETGYDILPFWVARMILMSTYIMGEVPFKTVYMHGMVLDKNGKKMSKSKPETTIDPLETIAKSGADALRMAMLVGVGPGQDVSLSEDKIRAYSKFSNKIWNATRFVLENTEDFDLESETEPIQLHQNYITEWEELLKESTAEMKDYKYYLVGEKLYHFFWHTFADIVIEKCKTDIIENVNEKRVNSAKYTLIHLLKEQLKALHPFMPFITEEIWGSLPGNEGKLLMIEKWPTV
ncbi:MAG: valyl-tRNA synthetase [Candidatus Paceibacteria bacterium]|jgi:valyl-tRNA synthetase